MKTILFTKYFIFLTLLIAKYCNTEVANYTTIPNGTHPTLYTDEDYVIQLDNDTFIDTVYCENQENCTAFIVEYYADWCGHCRSYAPMYKDLANDIKKWMKVVKIAAINCADPFNIPICNSHSIQSLPTIKYFERNSKLTSVGAKFKAYHNLASMRKQIVEFVIREQQLNKYENWPNFGYIGEIERFSQLWTGLNENTTTMAILFDNVKNDLIGSLILLDLSYYSNKMAIKRSDKNHPLASAFGLVDYPTVVIIKRGEKKPIFISDLRKMISGEMDSYFNDDSKVESIINHTPERLNRSSIDCNTSPELCKPKYFVSESDMLKAIKRALTDEVNLAGNKSLLDINSLTALYNFVNILNNFYPEHTNNGTNNTDIEILENSSKAKQIFHNLKQFLTTKMAKGSLELGEWNEEFKKLENQYDKPFADGADWDHCKGTEPNSRGYSCGLWTLLHTITVSAYKTSLESESVQPLEVLHSIRGWVGAFFGCGYCREHFLDMTGKTFKIEDHMKGKKDIYLYLWKAHNIVNKRLRTYGAEDPGFKKYQFPAKFLCKECNEDPKSLDNPKTHEFLLDYYTKIKPYVKKSN
uniref:Sulfhydryl oxidase n=1 Tax=Parastrongyloides trichosuri TaxID=131310 RepID=A0A0N4Z162_PARTI